MDKNNFDRKISNYQTDKQAPRASCSKHKKEAALKIPKML